MEVDIEQQNSQLERAAGLFRAIGDSGRLRVLQALNGTEMNVSELSEKLGEDISVVSHRLKILYQQSLVARKKKGSFVYYSLHDDHVHQLLTNAVNHTFHCDADHTPAEKGKSFGS